MDRIIRTQGAAINYLEFDHNTGLHTAGRHGSFQLGTINTAKITNNMFHNVLFLGNNPGTEEQTQPEDDDFYQITIDTIMATGQSIEIRNNNFAFDPEVEAYWATNDSVSKPAVLTPSVIQVIGESAVAAAYSEELVEFTDVPPVPMDYLMGVYQNPLTTSQPENMNIDDVGIENIDASYANTYAAYTASDRGFPLGDLNHFPELKELWLTGGSVSTEQLSTLNETKVKVFPNPVTSMATFVFELEKTQNVTIDIYNINGQKVASVCDGMANAGLNQIRWDANASGQTMATGVYIYKMIVDQKHQSGYIVITK